MTQTNTLPIEDQVIGNQFTMGQYIDVEIQNFNDDRFHTKLIGVKDGQYLILDQPDMKRYGLMRNRVKEKQLVIIRTIFEDDAGECVAFRSVIRSVMKAPYRLFFVSFPSEIEVHELRKEKRIETRIPASIYMSKKGKHIEGTMTDISPNGGCFSFKVTDKIKGIKPEYLFIKFKHPSNGEEVEQRAKVCSQKKGQDSISLGLSFDERIKELA